ncbi:hypothetical protein [Amycolatopsis decaplanina]|nr:hypothetical protein [Amycolatopsis decaplanina]
MNTSSACAAVARRSVPRESIASAADAWHPGCDSGHWGPMNPDSETG